MVASGRHGRKTGRGWYAYDEAGAIVREQDAAGAARRDRRPGRRHGRDRRRPAGRRRAARRWRSRPAGTCATRATPAGDVPDLIVDCGGAPGDDPLQGGPVAVLCAEGSLAALDGGGAAVGFHALPPLAAGGLVELTRTTGTSAHSAERAERFFATLGLHTARVGDAPGLVLGPHRLPARQRGGVRARRGRRLARDDIDAGMVLGLNHPRGPLAWGDAIGLDHVLAVLDALHAERGDPAYRAAPLLRELVLTGRLGVADRATASTSTRDG